MTNHLIFIIHCTCTYLVPYALTVLKDVSLQGEEKNAVNTLKCGLEFNQFFFFFFNYR